MALDLPRSRNYLIINLICLTAGLAVLVKPAAWAQQINAPSGSGSTGFNVGYNDGDLVLAFFSASDTAATSGANSHGDVLFNLGSVSSFMNLSTGTYAVAGFNGSSTAGQPPVGFGSAEVINNLTAPSSDTFWTVMGSNTTTNQLWLSGVTALMPLTNPLTLVTRVSAIGSGAANNANPDGSAYDSAQTTGNYLIPTSGRWAGQTASSMAAVSSTSDSMGLYSLSSAGTSTELGVFTLTDTNGQESLTYSPEATSGSGSSTAASGTRLVNISSRAFVGTGAELEIAGFVISGPAGSSEQVLVRGVGPALANYGVSGFLTNPILTLYDSAGNQVATNTGWSTAANAPAIAAAATSTGAFALPADSADSALLVSLAPGAYTAEVAGVGGATGVALAEVYEVTSGTPELINISTRAYVGTGASVEIGGFVINGSQSETVLVRAVGPTLSQFGVSSPLATPTLSVVDSAGTTVASNTGWSTAANASAIAAAATATGAFALPSGSSDSALLLTLAPGAYTAVVSGSDGASGIALVEIYEDE